MNGAGSAETIFYFLGKTFYALFCGIAQNHEKRAFLIEKTG